MADYTSVSMCNDCKIVFPNGFAKVSVENSKEIKERVVSKNSTMKIKCPDCGKEITHLLDDCYWVRIS